MPAWLPGCLAAWLPGCLPAYVHLFPTHTAHTVGPFHLYGPKEWRPQAIPVFDWLVGTPRPKIDGTISKAKPKMDGFLVSFPSTHP